ncbi:hypothetical protein [Streptomyces sp. NRRL B-24484]|uniref:hypothetical protein n=1 Tax=Streptomyces sp. NRRL B-24484 TaxID=1463833 RepID=UPI000694B6E1|nr:hypothetical protein [Streptomyces sp. NRRL B-24484]
MAVSTALRERYHRTARFWPARRGELGDSSLSWPAIQMAGVIVFTYVDENTLVVSIDLDTVHRGLVERPGTTATVPLHVMVQGTTVFYAPSERSGHTAWRMVGPDGDITVFADDEAREAERLAGRSGGRLQFRDAGSAEWQSAQPEQLRLPWSRRWRMAVRAAAARARAQFVRRDASGRRSR